MFKNVLLLCFTFQPFVINANTWHSDFTLGLNTFGKDTSMWGKGNLKIQFDEPELYMRVFIPKNTYDPRSMRLMGKPVGGAGFKYQVCNGNESHAILSYDLRFDKDMDFVLGGKLPGLYGGIGNSGGNSANGTNGFSFRYMWGKEAKGGSIYAYIPHSGNWGLPIFGGGIKFQKGVWQTLRQEVILNEPGLSNGVLRVWLDNKLIGEKSDLNIRATQNLGVNGLFFDVFFGGGSEEWASRSDVFIDFKKFELNCQ